jgi:GTPase SAR1 family protein
MPAERSERELPPGITLRRTLRGHKDRVCGLAWTPDGTRLVSASADGALKIWNLDSGEVLNTLQGYKCDVYPVAVTPDGRRAVTGLGNDSLRVWDLDLGRELRTLNGHKGSVHAVVVTPNGRRAVTGSEDFTLKVWDVDSGEEVRTLHGHSHLVYGVAVTPDGRRVVSASADKTLKVWDLESGAELRTLAGHQQDVNAVAITPDGRRIVSASDDRTLKVWDLLSGRPERTLEAHIKFVVGVSCSPDSRLLGSLGWDDSLKVWDWASGRVVASIEEHSGTTVPAPLAFHPRLPLLASYGGKGSKVVQLWELDYAALLGPATGAAAAQAVQYTNAKVVLVGDSGVGKSGLALVLAGQGFQPTESTHGRHVWVLDGRTVPVQNGEEIRETLLWDLAGQPGYRLIHQLHLNEVAVALVVIDARSETDAFAGVRHWDRALRQALRVQGAAALPLKKFLVAARADRGGVAASAQRIANLVREHGFDAFFETSAKEGWQVAELAEAIRGAIDWQALPRVNSNELFQRLKRFLVAEKEAGRLLATADELYGRLLQSADDLADSPLLGAQFDTCIGRVEARDLIRRLNFGNLVLLQPEMLDAYASALVNAAKDEPDGLGCIAEGAARAAAFRMPADERIQDREQERLLLIATIEDMLRHEIALREEPEDGPQLVFPSQFSRDWEEAPDPPGKAVVFTFEGPVLNVYATLAVRLSHSGLFARDEMWRNAAAYRARDGGRCGVYLREFGEGRAELTLFFDPAVGADTRATFEDYVYAHLRRRALSETIVRRRVFRCPNCDTPVPDAYARARLERGYTGITCGVCETSVPLVDRSEEERRRDSPAVAEMDHTADAARDRSAAVLTLEGKRQTQDFDVFLCYHNRERAAVRRIGERLKERGFLPWLDEWEASAGTPWPELLSQQLKQIQSAAVFVGGKGPAPWQEEQLSEFLRAFRRRDCPVIPVLLPGTTARPELPPFLEGSDWVDFGEEDADPLEQLIAAITGKPFRSPGAGKKGGRRRS